MARLEKTYQAFFRRVQAGKKPGFPRFQGKDRYHSFTYKTLYVKERSWFGTGAPRRRVGLIVGIALGAIILLAVVGYGGAVIVTNQQVAQAQIQANGKAVTGVSSIALENYAFSPAHVQVPVGTTITWTNDDTAPHSVTFTGGLSVDSGLFAQGKKFSYTFTQPGDYTYRCSVHPAMIGKVTVVPAGH